MKAKLVSVMINYNCWWQVLPYCRWAQVLPKDPGSGVLLQGAGSQVQPDGPESRVLPEGFGFGVLPKGLWSRALPEGPRSYLSSMLKFIIALFLNPNLGELFKDNRMTVGDGGGRWWVKLLLSKTRQDYSRNLFQVLDF